MNKKLIIVILLLFALIALADSYKVFPNPPPSASESSQSTGSVKAQGTLYQKGETVYSTSSSNHYYSSYESGDALKIKKSISPNNIDYCLIKRSACLTTEIKGTKWTSNNIYIKDYVEDPLRITNISQQPYVYDPFGRMISSKGNINYSINNSNLNIYVKNLQPNNRIKYAYEIISDKTGSYESNMILRTGNTSSSTDLDYSKEILVKYPEFDVNVDLDKLEVSSNSLFSNDLLHITYNILYTSNSLSPIRCNLSFDNTNPKDFDIFIDDGEIYDGGRLVKAINAENYTPIDVYIRYKNAGPHRIPSIIIDEIPYVFDYEIDVKSWLAELFDQYYQFLSILALIVTLYYNHHEIKIMREQVSHMQQGNNNELILRNSQQKSEIRIILSRLKKMSTTYLCRLFYKFKNIYNYKK